MQTWIITGGIGCGKTSVCDSLTAHGQGRILFYSADKVAQQLLDDPVIVRQLAAIFGQEAVAKDTGVANRGWLRERVFNDPEARRRLEMLLHPAVLATLEMARSAAREAADINLFLAEVPLHYEIGATISADLVIVVAASQAMQVRRLKERRGLDEAIIAQMLRSQWPIEAKVEKADVVIWNDGSPLALESQVLTLARQHRQE